ncbi:MAG: DUF370 domain-containing protein [Clostridia bacterium]|nr:DUF370 domain-containing protein [Clostridia bacterium]
MFLHAGAGTVVRGEDIIGIFDLDGKITTADTAAFLRRAEKDHVAELAGDDLPKCFLVAVPKKCSRRMRRKKRCRVILSHLSTAALGGRAAVSLI